jgi:hypothetical protein
MKNIINKSFWITLGLFLSTTTSAQAFSLDLTASVGEVDTNINASSTINQTGTPNGFGNFFQSQNDPFTVLGSSPNSTIPSGNNNSILTSTAVSNQITISSANAGKPLFLNFDWSFQGNSLGVEGIRLDTFTVSLVSVGVDGSGNPNFSSDLFITNQYQEKRGESLSISGGLVAGNYKVKISVIEPTVISTEFITQNNLTLTSLQIANYQAALALDNSAAGIDNLDISAVPFEFSPTLGVLIVGSFWGLLSWKKQKANASKLG